MPAAAQIVGDSTLPDIYSTGEDGISSISRLCYQLAGQLVDANIATGNRLHTSVYKPFHTTPAAADFPLVRWNCSCFGEGVKPLIL